jgi:hypothetical protein
MQFRLKVTSGSVGSVARSLRFGWRRNHGRDDSTGLLLRQLGVSVQEVFLRGHHDPYSHGSRRSAW